MMSSAFVASLTVAESPLYIKMGFLRKYFGIIAVQLLFISLISTVIMLSPIARFYVTENDWLLFVMGFSFFVSYLSLVRLIKHPVIHLLFAIHVGIQALTVGLMITYYDLMFLLQAVLLIACTVVMLFLYTLQSKRDCNIWTIIIISCICILSASASFKVIFGGTEEENMFSILIAIFLLIYHFYALFTIINTLNPADHILAVVNLHILPVNFLVFSSAVYKPLI